MIIEFLKVFVIFWVVCIIIIDGESELLKQFKTDLSLLNNENTFLSGMDHFGSLFVNESIIEMNERVWAGHNQIQSFINMHKRTFRRIQFDIIGGSNNDMSFTTESVSPVASDDDSNINEYESSYFYKKYQSSIIETTTMNHRVLSMTIYATYIPRDLLGCSSMMRFMAIFYYHYNDNKIIKMLLTSPTSLLEWEEQLACNWVAPKEELIYTLKRLMTGMYRDKDVPGMVSDYYNINSKLTVDESIYIGRDQIINWYESWKALGIDNVYNFLDEIDVIGNTVMIRVITMASHASGKCSQSFLWYGLLRFNGHKKIINEQRFYHQTQLKDAVTILGNCGDMSPKKTKNEL